MKVFVVITEFGHYARGHVITDQDEQDKVRASHPGHVVAAEHADPAPLPASPK